MINFPNPIIIFSTYIISIYLLFKKENKETLTLKNAKEEVKRE